MKGYENKEKLVYVDETGIIISRTSEGPKRTKNYRTGRKFARQSIVAAKCGFGTIRIQWNLRYKVVQFLDKRKIAP